MKRFKVKQEEYIEFGKHILVQLGVPDHHAEIQVKHLLDADRKGIHTHGLYRMNRYMEQLARKDINPRPKIVTVETNKETIALMDGDHGLGAVIGHIAMENAIELSKKYGVGITGVKNSNHFGTAGYFSELAAKENQIGLVFSNSSPSIAPTGSKKPILGNNPWSISVPTDQGFFITLDISNGKVARGKIRLAKEKGQKIPKGWALDADGNPTTDPAEALEGIILPMGDHKGYGITLMIEILAGVLTGADFGTKMIGLDEKGQRNVGHLFVSIDIPSLMDIDEFYKKINQLIEMIKSAPRIDYKQEVLLPGEREWTNKQTYTEDVWLSRETLQIIYRQCKVFSIDLTCTRLFNRSELFSDE